MPSLCKNTTVWVTPEALLLPFYGILSGTCATIFVETIWLSYVMQGTSIVRVNTPLSTFVLIHFAGFRVEFHRKDAI